MNHKLRKWAPLAASTALVMAVAATSALASHQNIVLKDKDGNPISASGGLTGKPAFSMKKTCFGTAGCHGDATLTSKVKYSYDEIERHSYHAGLAANEQRGWNPWNPDSTDPFKKGVGPKGKNWVQAPGHIGAW